MIQYLLEVSLCWIILISIYYVFLRKETFFHSNRWFLLHSLWLGMSLPLLKLLPYKMQHDAIYTETIHTINTSTLQLAESLELPVASSFWNGHTIAWMVYIIGFLVVLSRVGYGLFKIYSIYKPAKKVKKGKFTLVVTETFHLPFSFFHYVFIHKNMLKKEYIKTVLEHELIHIRHLHSFDIFALQFLSIVFWWNPILYLYKKAIKETHEYVADAYATVDSDIKNYGQILLGQSSSGIELALTNQFFNSFLKQRMRMLQQKKSAGYKRSKYLLAIPVLAFMFILFSSSSLPDIMESKIDESTTELRHIESSQQEITQEKELHEPIQKIKKDQQVKPKPATIKKEIEPQQSQKELPIVKHIGASPEIKKVGIQKTKSAPLKKEVTIIASPIIKNITGRILNAETKEPLIGATILIENTEKGTITDLEGKFTLDISSNDDFVIISYVGFESKKVAISTIQSSDIYLNKSDFKARITINSDENYEQEIDLKNFKGDNYIFILDGKEVDKKTIKKLQSKEIATVDIYKTKDSSKSTIHIVTKPYALSKKQLEKDVNETMTLSYKKGDEDILIVIDGEKKSKFDAENLLPDDIKSITVLKGDEAVKIYGKDHSSGVIEILLKDEKELKEDQKKEKKKKKKGLFRKR